MRRFKCSVFVLAAVLGSVGGFPGVGHTQSGGAGGSGSGQFTGLAAAPEANMFSGSMSTSVPIQIPPGRKNMTPQLQLSYSSGGGSGPFGYGWSLPLGTVERSTKHGRPRCTGDYIRDFVLSLSGGQMELADHGPINSSLKRKYLPRIDESYLVAEGDETHTPTNKNRWEVYDRAGMTYRFGFLPESRVWHKYDRFILEDAPLDTCEFTSIWALDEIVDPNGNNMRVKWFKDENTLYPDEITYGANASAGLGEHPFKVEFKRAPRSQFGGEVVEQSHRGVKEEIHHVINRIEVSYRPELGQDYQLIRAYDLNYTASNGRLLLTSVDDDPNIVGDLLPPQTFTYATAPFNHDTVVTYNHPQHSLSHSFTQATSSSGPTAHAITHRTLMDVNGDGMTDLVVGGEGWQTYPGWNVYLWKRDAGPSGQGGISLTSVNWPSGSYIRREENDGSDHGNPSYRGVHIDTVDVTGDGLPDRIDTRYWSTSGSWRVYPLSCTGPESCSFDSQYIDWPAPAKYTDYSTKSGNTWTARWRLVDVSGDGLPDYVKDGLVYLNTGSGFDEVAPDATLQVNTESYSPSGPGVSTTNRAYIDFNGDGLPDELKKSGTNTMTLRLNTGRGYGNAITLNTPGNNVVQSSTSGGGQWGSSTTYLDFFDVNADGLSDRVRVSGGQWLVQLNQAGRSLGTEQVWHSSLPNIRKQVTFADPEHDGGVKSYSWGKVDLFDFDGDGFVDRVDAGATPWQIHLGKPDGDHVKPLLLVKAENGIGGVTEVSYAPAVDFDHTTADGSPDYDLPFNNWLVTEITRTDGLSPAITKSFSYEGGLFDTNTREFRGFQKVTQTDSDGNQRVVTYSQDDYTKGKTLLSQQFAGDAQTGQLMSQQTSVWNLVASPGRVQVFLAESRNEEFDLVAGEDFDRCVLNRNEPPDPYGRVGHSCSLSCSQDQAGPADCSNAQIGQVDTVTTWAEPDSQSEQLLRERPLSITTEYVNAQGQVETLAHKEFYYDGDPSCGYPSNCGSTEVDEGNVRRVRSMVSESPTVWTTVWNSYDAFGNITKVTDPEGHSSESFYNTALFSLYPVSEINALGHEVHTETDLSIGKPTKKTGANGEIAQMQYDALGRPLCEAAPGETLAGCTTDGPLTVQKQYRYHRGDPTAHPVTDFEATLSYVEVRTREPNAPNGYLVSRQYTDGLGRKRVATTEQVIGADTNLSTVVAEHIDYGQGGRVSAKYVPYKQVGSLVQAPSVDKTVFDYTLNDTGVIDPRGRAHVVYPPDAAPPPGQANGKEMVTYYEGRRTRVLSAQGTPHANAAHSIEDDFGRVIRKESYAGAMLATYFDNTYDGMGRVLTERVAGAEATVVTHHYDLLGRETSLDDPDSGIWAFKYDKNGNVLFRDDPEVDQHVQWLYDALGRVTHVCMFGDDDYVALATHCGTGTAESTYVYDDPAVPYSVGRLTHVNDLSGFEEFVYDIRGRVTEQTRSIGGSSTGIGSPVAATMSFEYDFVDRVKKSIYPDGQEVIHEYNKAGRPYRLHSNGNYVTSTDYDLLGRLDKLVHGNGVEDRRQYFTAGTENHRLWKIITSKGANSYLDLEYGYNALGKVANIVDHRNAQGDLSNAAEYTYDALGRLIAYDRVPDANPATNDDVFSYSAIGNITLKGGQALQYNDPFGPHRVSSYDGNSFSYNENGERTAKGAETYAYDALGRLTQVITAGGDTVDYRYDYGGRRTAKRVNDGDWTRYFSSAAESEVDDQGQGWLVKYYFAGDTRVATKREQNNTLVDPASVAPVPFTVPAWIWWLLLGAVGVLFLMPSRREAQLGLAVGPAPALGGALLMLVISGPAFVALTACDIITQPPKPKVEHYHGDHLGSTQVVTNPNGNIDRQVRYEPYGEVRGRFHANGSPVNVDEDKYQHEFTGYETEIESGLQYAGARYFDPEVAQFLSHDPERQYASPYAYGPGDPMNGTDPDGRIFGITAALVIAFAKAVAVGAAIGAVASFGMALIQGASFKQALKAAGQGAIQGAIMGAFNFIFPPLGSTGAAEVYNGSGIGTAKLAVRIAHDGYQTVKAATDGNYVGAALGALNLIAAAGGFGSGLDGQDTSANASGARNFTEKQCAQACRGQAADAAEKVAKIDEKLERINADIEALSAEIANTEKAISEHSLLPTHGDNAKNVFLDIAETALTGFSTSAGSGPGKLGPLTEEVWGRAIALDGMKDKVARLQGEVGALQSKAASLSRQRARYVRIHNRYRPLNPIK